MVSKHHILLRVSPLCLSPALAHDHLAPITSLLKVEPWLSGQNALAELTARPDVGGEFEIYNPL